MSDLENVSGTGETAAPPSAPATPAVATPTAPAPQVATSPAPTVASPTTGQPPEGYVPSYRLRETREAAQREAQQHYTQYVRQAQAEAAQYKEQLQRLVGGQPAPDPQIAAVRDQFGQLYPGLTKMEERAQQIMDLLDRSGDLENQNQHYWQSYGRQTMDTLFKHAAETIGTPLTDEAKRVLHSSFVGFVQSSPEMTARYSSDPTIVEDFWKAFSSNFIDPSRRAATAAVAGRAPGALPQDTPGGAPRLSTGPQPANLDERVAQAWAQYQSTKT